MIKRVLLLTLIVLISVSLASGLKLSASTGSNDVRSNLGMVYGAQTIDALDQKIKLNAGEGTISNHVSATGSLPYNYLSINDANGNYAYVDRSVSGNLGVTSYSYDWNTYETTSGVGAQLWLSASKAYKIYGGGYASNSKGDIARASITVGDSYPYTTSALSNYYANPYASTGGATAYQSADYASGSSISVGPTATNGEGDQAWGSITLPSGSLSEYSGYASATSTSAGTSQNSKSMSGSSITAGSSSKNSKGDQAWDTTTLLSGSLSGYKDAAYTTIGQAGSSQSINSVTGSSIKAGSVAKNTKGDYSYANINSATGVMSGYSVLTATTKTTAYTAPKASTISITGTSSALYASASNREGDSSIFNLKLTNGKITNPNFYASSGTRFAETKGSVSNLYGSVAEINTKALSKILGYQEKGSTRIKTDVLKAEGDFAAKKTSNAQFGAVSVTTRATNSNTYRSQNDITISTTGFGAKTALILDPRREEFVQWNGGSEIRDSVMDSLKNKGYAVSYFSDSAVTKGKVKQMDEYKVSTIVTHSSPTIIFLSKSSDGVNWDRMSASELKSEYKKYNGMAIVDGCSSFAKTGSGTWADAMNKANVRGGTTESWSTTYVRSFINRYYYYMYKGYSAYWANEKAKGLDVIFDSNGKATKSYKVKSLKLLGNPNFVL
ncbi:MAG: hypothetical protein M0Q13_08920 [Methanothrix sp.]|jgi:hypothetical protein|nr:hypothetical protein [Methanothrix sp.]